LKQLKKCFVELHLYVLLILCVICANIYFNVLVWSYFNSSSYACWNSVYQRIFLFKPWESERTDKLFRKNEFRAFILSETVVFLNSMMHFDHNVITLVLRVFIHSVEFCKLCNLVCVSPYDSMCKIKRFMKLKFISSVTSDWTTMWYCVVYTYFFSLLYLRFCKINVYILCGT